MEISDFEYTRMAQWIEQQRRQIAALERENHDLRRQVDDLRRGVGMSIVVQGRVIPVNPAPAEAPMPNAAPMPHPSFGPLAQSNPPAQAAQAAPPSQSYHSRSVQHELPVARSEVFSEELWITGQMRAVHASAPVPVARPISPSQDMTPTWLREDAAPTPVPARRRTLASATGSQPALPKPSPQQSQQSQPRSARPDNSQAGRQRVPARPLSRPSVPRLEAMPLPSLAELTGQHPAVSIPGRRQPQPEPGERTPYSDSFVLG